MNESATAAPLEPRILDALRSAVGDEYVSVDLAERALRSQDVFQWDEAPLVDVVVQPGSSADVSAVLRLAGTHGLAVAPRGGGVSYTKGYVPLSRPTISLDLRRMDDIIKIDPESRFATIGAACTWERLAGALHPYGLRSAVRGPISGGVATVGGVASQNSGSASMAGFLSLEVVLPNGEIVHTGSGGRRDHPTPFYRNYGPDLTGLFLGDTGTFGIKTRCTVALEPIPAGVAFASVAFEGLRETSETMIAISRSGIPCRVLGMDQLKNRTATQVGIMEGLATLASVVKHAGSVATGLRQAAGIAVSGQNVLAEARWSMHVTVEGHDQTAADHGLAALRPLWSLRGRELQPSVPTALNARPFSIRGILGLAGERWVPVHGLFPFASATEVVERTEAFFREHAARLQAHGIEHSYLVMSFATHWLLEPMFYWPDAPGPLTTQVLGGKGARFQGIPSNPQTRAVVRELRRSLADLFRELGAVHSQLGKFYAFRENLEPATWTALTAIKDLLDPAHLLNPGNLGWDP